MREGVRSLAGQVDDGVEFGINDTEGWVEVVVLEVVPEDVHLVESGTGDFRPVCLEVGEGGLGGLASVRGRDGVAIDLPARLSDPDPGARLDGIHGVADQVDLGPEVIISPGDVDAFIVWVAVGQDEVASLNDGGVGGYKDSTVSTLQ